MKPGLIGGIAAACMMVASCMTGAHAQEKGLENPRSAAFHSGLEGKKVVFVPLSMGFDLTEGWAARMKAQAKRLNYSFEIRDPNWSTDAGARALQSLISEKPDLIVVHNPDIQSYARLLKQAQAAGIKIVQINLESNTQTNSMSGQIGQRSASRRPTPSSRSAARAKASRPRSLSTPACRLPPPTSSSSTASTAC